MQNILNNLRKGILANNTLLKAEGNAGQSLLGWVQKSLLTKCANLLGTSSSAPLSNTLLRLCSASVSSGTSSSSSSLCSDSR